MMQDVPQGNVSNFYLDFVAKPKEEQMGDKGDKNKHKHDKQAMIAKADAEKKKHQQPTQSSKNFGK